MSVQDEIARIQNGKSDLIEAISEYGVEISSDTPIEETGDKVRQIGDRFYTKTESDNKYATKETVSEIQAEIEPLTDEEVDSLWADTPLDGEIPAFSMTEGYVPVWNGTTFEDGIALEEIGSDIEIDQNYNENSSNPQSGIAVAQAVEQAVEQVKEECLNETQVNEIVDTKINTFNTDTVQPQKMNFAYYNEDTLVANTKHTIKSNGYYMCFCNNAKLKLCKADGTVMVENAKQIQMMTARGATSTNSSNFKACGQYWTGSTSILSGMPIEGFRRTLNDGSYVTADEEFAVCQMVQGD